MRQILFVILIMGSLFRCTSPDREELIIGAWQVDSTYSYYNGFNYVQRKAGPDWATYVYDEEGIMKEIKFGSFQSYFFEFYSRDSIIVRPTQGGDETNFEILQLNAQKMVLKKNMQPIFNGPKQERYEIRFFSRTDLPEAASIPFSDPRK